MYVRGDGTAPEKLSAIASPARISPHSLMLLAACSQSESE
jgi:hypothetical protein